MSLGVAHRLALGFFTPESAGNQQIQRKHMDKAPKMESTLQMQEGLTYAGGLKIARGLTRRRPHTQEASSRESPRHAPVRGNMHVRTVSIDTQFVQYYFGGLGCRAEDCFECLYSGQH